MASGTHTIAKGREAYYASLPAASDSLIAVLLRGVESDDLLRRHDTLSALLGANTEANFTGYTRKTLASVTLTVDDDADTPIADANDVVWDPAGGATDNTIVKLLVCYKPASGSADSVIVPVWYWDSQLPVTTDGSSLTIQPAVEGLWRTADQTS